MSMNKSAAARPSSSLPLLPIKATPFSNYWYQSYHQHQYIMKFPKSHNQLMKSTPKRHKNRLSEDQLRLLEASFTHEKKLEPERKFQLAYELGLPPKQVAIWYQNKRARWKTQNIELDYRAIQLRLDSVLADRGRLQKEVMRLRMELQRSQEALYAMNLNQPPIPSLNISCEEDGSSSLPSDANCPWENTDALRVDEVYAFLMGTSDQTSMLQTNNSLFNQATS